MGKPKQTCGKRTRAESCLSAKLGTRMVAINGTNGTQRLAAQTQAHCQTHRLSDTRWRANLGGSFALLKTILNDNRFKPESEDTDGLKRATKELSKLGLLESTLSHIHRLEETVVRLGQAKKGNPAAAGDRILNTYREAFLAMELEFQGKSSDSFSNQTNLNRVPFESKAGTDSEESGFSELSVGNSSLEMQETPQALFPESHVLPTYYVTLSQPSSAAQATLAAHSRLETNLRYPWQGTGHLASSSSFVDPSSHSEIASTLSVPFTPKRTFLQEVQENTETPDMERTVRTKFAPPKLSARCRRKLNLEEAVEGSMSSQLKGGGDGPQSHLTKTSTVINDWPSPDPLNDSTSSLVNQIVDLNEISGVDIASLCDSLQDDCGLSDFFPEFKDEHLEPFSDSPQVKLNDSLGSNESDFNDKLLRDFLFCRETFSPKAHEEMVVSPVPLRYGLSNEKDPFMQNDCENSYDEFSVFPGLNGEDSSSAI